MAFIDPTDNNLSGVTNYEKLNIYVDLKAQRRGNTVINNDSNKIVTDTIASGIFNMMGYENIKKDDRSTKIFTTKYSEIYNKDSKINGYYEGFGITNISIEVNSSYVPTVKIDFVDIKGMSFFNNKKDSPYSVLFDFPPPIYTLTVKGYYGYALEYKLHMLRQNTRFDAETGNYYISAEFVGNTFAPLADILYQYVLTVSTLEGEKNSSDSTDEVRNIKELVQRSKKIKEEIADKLKAETKEIEKVEGELTIITDLINKENELVNNIKYVEINQNITVNPIIKESNFKITESNINNEIYLYMPVKKIDNALSPSNRILNDYISLLFLNNNNNNSTYFGSSSNKIIYSDGTINNIQIADEPIIYFEITGFIKNINNLLNDKTTEFDRITEKITEQGNKIITGNLGFTPTVKNVMEIICKDIDRWVSTLGETYNESIRYINDNRSSFNSVLKVNDNDIIYPFPDYIERDTFKKIPTIAPLSGLPEVQLVDKFIDAFVQNKIKERETPTNTESVTDVNGNNIWFPINPLDSTFHNTGNTSPYNNLLSHIDVIKTFFARYYVFHYYTLTSGKNDDKIFSNIYINFFNNEIDNLINTINQVNILKALKEINIDENNIKNSLLRLLNNEITNKSTIENILTKININDINEDFSGIEFTDKNIVIKDKVEREKKSGGFEQYLNIDPQMISNSLNISSRSVSFGRNIYELSKINSSDFGLTLNKENNIIFYDGNSEENTSFIGINETNVFNNIIVDSLNIKSVYKVYFPFGNTVIEKVKDLIDFTKGKKKSELIRESYNINKIIYNQYFDSNNEFKSFFGYINLIYVPNLKHIITVLMNKSIICNLPFIVKLYVSAYVYGIENNLIDVTEDDPEIDKFDSDNKDFIFNVYKVNSITKNSNLFKNHVNVRKDFIKLLNNLTDKDKNLFIEFYEKTINDRLFVNKFNSLIDSIKNKSFFTEDIVARRDDLLKVDNIENQAIIVDLRKKTNIIVKSNYTFSEKNSFNVFDNFFTDDIIKENFNNSFNNPNFIQYINSFFKTLKSTLNTRINDLNNQNENEFRSQVRNKNSFDEIRTETYYSFKNFVDRWVTPINGTTVDISKGFLLIDNIGGFSENNVVTTPKFIDLFAFVNRWYDSTDAENIIIDTTILADFETDLNINMLTVIGRLLNHNGFEFYPLQNFIDYSNNENIENGRSSVIFTPFLNRNNILTSPRFTCMYIGGKSRFLNSESNKNTLFKDDGFTSKKLPDDSPQSEKKWFGFLVKFGDGKQSIFSQIEIGTDEHQPTNESLSTMSQILDGENTPVPVHQNLFSTYEQRSYTCKVKMFGNVMIQPTQLFDLQNVPMFNGVYMILKVNHTIDGATNSMVTEFEGVRLPKEPREFITNPFQVYGKDVFSNINRFPLTKLENANERSLPIKDRKIYLVAGHNLNNQSGAVSFINGREIREEVLNIELRDIIKNNLKEQGIEVETDDDTKTLQEVINDLNNKVEEDDIVLDIHFNFNTSPSANGTEVFIKEDTNEFVIELGKNIINAIVKETGFTKRKGNSNLPTGIKLPSESNVGTLGILNLKTNVILIEVCFISNPKEMNIYEARKKEIGAAIANVLKNTKISEQDKDLVNVQTFGSLNNLKYDNINNRLEPFKLLNKEKIKTTLITRLRNNYYNFTSEKGEVTEATVFKDLNISKSTYIDLVFNQIEQTAPKYNIDAMFIGGIINIESAFYPSAKSKDSALGITQFVRTSGLLDTLRKIQSPGNLTKTTNVYVLENNNFILKNLKYHQILGILLDKRFDSANINTHPIKFNNVSSDTLLKSLNDNNLLIVLEKNIFNNPFIMIELSGIYFKIIEGKGYSETINNKNMGILSISYNMGSVTSKYNQRAEKIYFENLRAKYNSKNANLDIKNKIVRAVENEGIEYPERLINEFLLPYGVINKSDLIKENIV